MRYNKWTKAMTDAREIIAGAMQDWFDRNGFLTYQNAADAILCALSRAGFRILGPDEVDQVTVEKCAAVADNLSETWSNSRDAFTVPEGYEPVLDVDGRVTREIRPIAPEGQQPAGVVWFGYNENTGEFTGESCSVEPHDSHRFRAYAPVATRPSEQAVTEAMVEALKEARSVIYDTQQACLFDDDDGQIGVTEDAVISPHHFQKLCSALGVVDHALKAAMEAGG